MNMNKEFIIKIVEFSSSFFTLPFIYIIKYYFYERFLGFKHEIWKFVLSSLLMTILNFLIVEITWEPFNIIIYNLLWLIIIYFLCNGNFLIKTYAILVEDTIFLLINMAFITFDFRILPLTQNVNMTFEQHMIISFLNNTLNDLSRLALLFILLKTICKLLDLKEKSLNLYHSLFLLIPCLAIYSLTIIFYLVQTIKIDEKKYYLTHIFPNIYYILPFVSCSLLISILITAYTFQKMLEGDEANKQRMLMEQQFNLQLKHSKNIEGLYNGIRSIKHDMNNHLACLRNLSNANDIEAIRNYLNTISKTINKIDFEIKTGNPISDAIINEKYNIAKIEGIQFICDFIIPKETSIDPIDLCVILSNSLDNSIEACMKISDYNIPKIICIKSYFKELYLIIEISNSTTNKLQYVENKIITTKSDATNHGIGFSNIKAAVEKYNGAIDILEEKNKFILNIMLKIK